MGNGPWGKKGRCRHCKEFFEKWKHGKHEIRKCCESCYHKIMKANGKLFSKKWKAGEIQRNPLPITWGSKGKRQHSNKHITIKKLIQQFIIASDYMSIRNHQKGVAMIHNTSGRSIRKYLNKFYPKRKKYGLGGRGIEKRFNKLEILNENIVTDEMIKNFVENYQQDKFDENNPVMKAIYYWNKNVESLKAKLDTCDGEEFRAVISSPSLIIERCDTNGNDEIRTDR